LARRLVVRRDLNGSERHTIWSVRTPMVQLNTDWLVVDNNEEENWELDPVRDNEISLRREMNN